MVVDTPLVSVVIPAYNASETIRETLASASGQTYGNLDIIVVDDGSTDDTGAIVHRHSLQDPRVRLVEKSNGGVASARNAGIRASRGTLVAFLDADDLWHPTKVSKQVKVLLAGGGEIALVYSPFRVIDINGKVLLSPRKYGASGWVLHRHFYANLIGNGSSILVRKSVLDEVGGFDPQLREAGAEGCEDLLLQLRVAARYRFGEVQEYLIGYRRRPASMSSNADQMIRSGALAIRIALSECRHLSRLPRDVILNRHEWQRLRHAARQGDVITALGYAWQQFTGNPALAAAALWNDLLLIGPRLADLIRSELADKLGSSAGLRHFYDYDPVTGIDRARPCPRAFRRLALMDLEYRPRSGNAAPARLANTFTDMATTR
jgi:glycosyltransferase involved in cell wall biosynthesis